MILSLFLIGYAVTAKHIGAGITLSGMEMSVTDEGNVTENGFVPFDIDEIDKYVKMNASVIRLPFAWQFMTPELGGELNKNYSAKYFSYVDRAIKLGAYAMIDLHNYARWDGMAAGQQLSNVTNDHIASLWGKIAKKYAEEPKVIFALMNEPHSLEMQRWLPTMQMCVNAIREANATSQMVLISGDVHGSSKAFPEWYRTLKNVTNPDGSKENIAFELHEYLDSANGTLLGTNCTSNTTQYLKKVFNILKKDNRTAFFSDAGGQGSPTCIERLSEQLTYLNSKPEQFLGYTIWGAGSVNDTITPQFGNSLIPQPPTKPLVKNETIAEKTLTDHLADVSNITMPSTTNVTESKKNNSSDTAELHKRDSLSTQVIINTVFVCEVTPNPQITTKTSTIYECASSPTPM